MIPTERLSNARPLLVTLIILGAATSVREADAADPPWRMNQRFEFRRLARIEPGAGKVPPVAVVEFLGHGQLSARAANVAVFDHDGPIPWKILQAGPGDFCRVAFQTGSRGGAFQIYYGGAEPETSPAWSAPLPLLLETRGWKECNLNSLASVQSAFDAAQPEGSNFVANVFHRWNPITSAPRPFLSHYSGTIQAPQNGNYAFFTSSEDASFLLIDGQQVVAAPGRHGPSGQANVKGQVVLMAGAHRLDYWHAASGESACMVAAWQPPGAGKPDVIPATVFAPPPALVSAAAARKRSGSSLPDFTYHSLGEVVLVDGSVPLVRVKFVDATSPRKSSGTKVRWDFGDGQSSDQHDAMHVYLRPGSYQVKFTRRKDGTEAEIINTISVERPLVLPDTEHPPDELAAYLPLLESYDPSRCDGTSLLQLVRAFEQLERWTSAVAAAKPAFKPDAIQIDEEARYELAQRVGAILRERLLKSPDAVDVWVSAADAVSKPEWSARCQIEAADLMINELDQIAEAKALLSSAGQLLKGGAAPELLSRYYRVRGDLLARQSEGQEARTAYELAARLLKDRRSEIAQNAWRGAHSRTVEAQLRDGVLAAARSELDLWLAEFPADKVEGYLPLLQARYWVARKSWSTAAMVAGDLVAVNASSPYADQLIHLAAQCESHLGHPARAAAAYRALLADYPGSPLIEDAKKELERLEANDVPAASSPKSKKAK